jgi:hypothetical protein
MDGRRVSHDWQLCQSNCHATLGALRLCSTPVWFLMQCRNQLKVSFIDLCLTFATMNSFRPLLTWLFWLSAGSLVLFCLLFGLPIVSSFTAGKVIALAGCKPPSFDMQAVCPPGSFATPFIPLSHWMTSIVAPLILIKNFGFLLIGWAATTFVLGVASSASDPKSDD